MSIVKKKSPSVEYSKRLRSQSQKQQRFHGLKIKNIHVPKVIASSDNNDIFEFDMEYVPCSDAITFLNIASISQVNKFWRNLEFFIETCMKNSTPTTIDADVYVDKFLSINEKIKSKDNSLTGFLQECHNIFAGIENTVICHGLCHGDLTLSNLLISKNCDIYLIDFLDTYFDSPIQDIVKLRQDTKFGWTQALYGAHYDKKRMSILLQYLDNIVDDKFSKFEFYKKLYHPTQLLNLLRILPYITNEHMFNNMVKLCEGVMNEC